MEVVTNEEVGDLQLKASDSLEDKDSHSNSKLVNVSYQQGHFGGLQGSSTDNQGMLEIIDNKFETKNENSVGGTKINSIVMKASKAKTHSVVKINKTSKKINKSYKENLEQEESKQTKSNLSNSAKSLIRIKTESISDSYEQSIKQTYKTFPKSIPSSININSNLIMVKFKFENSDFSSAFKTTLTVMEIKEWLCYILELGEDLVILEINDGEAQNSQTLADLSNQLNSKIVFKIVSKSERGNALLKENIEKNIPTLDVITVHLDEVERNKNIVVKIGNDSIQKQWLGGYRNKLTGTEYHNAYSQTMKEKNFFMFDEVSGEKIPLFFNRESQTPFPLIEKKVNTVANKATQMSRSDLYLTSNKDKIITVSSCTKNKTLDHEHIVRCVITIQRASRKFLGLIKFRSSVEMYLEELHNLKQVKEKIAQNEADRERTVITGSAYPVKREDFYSLFLKIENWWVKEWKKICKTKRLEEKRAAFAILIEKEIDLLQAIEKHKAAEKKESLKKEEIRFLERISRPELFRSSKGQLIMIDYLDTQKAREFKEIYSTLTCKDLTTRDRVEILITLKNMFESHYMSYEYAQDLVSLINREIQLIEIGMRLKDLKGLRSRIEQLFLDFLHQPEFNPSVKKFKKPNAPKILLQTFQCSGCLKLLPASKYNVHVRMSSFNQCFSCTWMKNIANQRANLSPYLKLLINVQNSEMEKCSYSALCFILQPIGMMYLTNVIWHGRSAISQCSDISKLKHIRWLSDVEWAPWNTILLTNQEAKLHNDIPDIFTFYDTNFIEKVRQKHILTRKRFTSLLEMNHAIRTSGEWYNVTDSGVFLDQSHSERIATESNEFDTI